jgi:Thin aggregative fimbriae synthesis protein
MMVDANLHVWFDVSPHQNQTLIVPYVESPRDARFQYALKVTNTGVAGTSNISQGGEVSVSAGHAEAVSSVQLTPQRGGTCEVDLTLREDDKQIGRYSCECSVKK